MFRSLTIVALFMTGIIASLLIEPDNPHESLVAMFFTAGVIVMVCLTFMHNNPTNNLTPEKLEKVNIKHKPSLGIFYEVPDVTYPLKNGERITGKLVVYSAHHRRIVIEPSDGGPRQSVGFDDLSVPIGCPPVVTSSDDPVVQSRIEKLTKNSYEEERES